MSHVEGEKTTMGEENNGEATSMHFGVGDPAIIKRKGSHNLAKDFFPKVRKCGYCREPGHMRTKCPQLAANNPVNENEETYESDLSTFHPQSLTGRDSSAYYPSFMHNDYSTNGCESTIEPNLVSLLLCIVNSLLSI